jgi:hypothetical protein
LSILFGIYVPKSSLKCLPKRVKHYLLPKLPIRFVEY